MLRLSLATLPFVLTACWSRGWAAGAAGATGGAAGTAGAAPGAAICCVLLVVLLVMLVVVPLLLQEKSPKMPIGRPATLQKNRDLNPRPKSRRWYARTASSESRRPCRCAS